MTGPAEDLDAFVAGPEATRLDGRHVLVTGAGRGLGKGIALSAVRFGAAVTVVARTAEQLDQTRRVSRELGIECSVEVADLADTDGIDALAERVWARGPVFGVVHAAAMQVRKPAVEVSAAEWRRVQTLNAEAPFLLSTAIGRRQLDAGLPGSHVFVGSLNSTLGLARQAPYAASKTALLGIARVLSTEWAARGIRANVVGPGYFDTELTRDLLADPANQARLLSRIPAGALGLPRDVGAATVFLLSDASSYVSGQLLNVDGGWLAS